MKYICYVPTTDDQGDSQFTCGGSLYETYRQNALHTYNSMRAHDGQAPLSRMPSGTHYTPIRNNQTGEG